MVDHYVFLPGFAFSARIWQAYQAEFGGELLEWPAHINNVDELAAVLVPRIKPNSVLVGWSLGGLIAILLADRYPALCRRVICVASVPRMVAASDWPGINEGVLQQFKTILETDQSRLLKTFVSLVQYPEKSLMLKNNLNQCVSAVNLAVYLQLLTKLDMREVVSRLPMPVHFVLGEKDAIVSQPTTIAAHVIPDAGHALVLSHQAELCKIIRQIAYRDLITSSFNKATEYDRYSQLQWRVGKTLITLLQSYVIKQSIVYDLGCGTGLVTSWLANQLQPTMIYALDMANELLQVAKRRHAMLNIHYVHADWMQTLHPRADIIFSNMALHWAYDFDFLLQHLQQQLNDNGVLAFTLPLTHTFQELPPCSRNDFFSLNAVKQLLEHHGFSILLASEEMHQYEYSSLKSALHYIKGVGANHLRGPKNNTLRGKSYFSSIKNQNGNYHLTYHIGYFVTKKSVTCL